MVRVVSQNFSPPRSRHSSGETDRDLAERASLALSVHGRKRPETTEYESSSDSYWDSEFDGDQCDGASCELGVATNDINGNETREKSDVQSKRKERRRERNKLSAQAYRQRRRNQSVKDHQTLVDLEAKNKELHSMVAALEKKTEQVKHLLRARVFPAVDVLQPIGEVEGATADQSDVELDQKSTLLSVKRGSPPHTPLSSLHSNPNPHLQLASFPQTLHSPAINGTVPQTSLMLTNKAPEFTSSTPHLSGLPLCPTLAPNVIYNTSILIDATASSPGAANLTAVPTFLVPVENYHKQMFPNSNMNCNLLRTSGQGSHSAIDRAAAENDSNDTKPTGDTYQVFNAILMKPSMCPVAGTLVGLVNVGLCNMNSGADERNGNSNCDTNMKLEKNHPHSQPLSFNLNQAADPTAGQDALCQKQCHANHQHQNMPVQYFLAPADQISVQ